MRTIGVRELKANLSRTLRDVQRGEFYLVTDRGRVVAELHAVNAASEGVHGVHGVHGVDAGLLKMAAAGELRLAERPRAPYRRTGPSFPDGTAQRLLDWDRGER